MIIPLSFMLAYLILSVRENKTKVFYLIASFVLIQAIVFAYNTHVYSSIYPRNLTGVISNPQNTGSASNLYRQLVSVYERMSYGFVGMLLFRFFTSKKYPYFSHSQKAILEYSPHLIFALSGLLILKRRNKLDGKLKTLLTSNIIYTLMIIWGKTNSFGGWSLSMRYLTPIIPLLVILSSGSIKRLLSLKQVLITLIFSMILSLLSPTIVFNELYHALSLTAILLVVLVVFFVIVNYFRILPKEETQNSLRILLTLMLLLSVFVNMNAVKIGNNSRIMSTEISEYALSRTEIDSLLLCPQGLELIEFPNRLVAYYPLVWSYPQSSDHLSTKAGFYSEFNDVVDVASRERPKYLVVLYENKTPVDDLKKDFKWDAVIHLSEVT